MEPVYLVLNYIGLYNLFQCAALTNRNIIRAVLKNLETANACVCVCVYRCGCSVCASQAPGAFGATAEWGWAGEGATLWHCPNTAGCWDGSCLQHSPAGDGGKINTPKHPETQQMHPNILELNICVCVRACSMIITECPCWPIDSSRRLCLRFLM